MVPVPERLISFSTNYYFNYMKTNKLMDVQIVNASTAWLFSLPKKDKLFNCNGHIIMFNH